MKNDTTVTFRIPVKLKKILIEKAQTHEMGLSEYLLILIDKLVNFTKRETIAVIGEIVKYQDGHEKGMALLKTEIEAYEKTKEMYINVKAAAAAERVVKGGEPIPLPLNMKG